MESIVNIRTYENLDFNEKEILRYARCEGASEDSDMVRLMRECIDRLKCEQVCSYKLSYRVLPILEKKEDGTLDFGIIKYKSYDLYKCLKDCDMAVFLAGTIGHNLDRIIYTATRLSPAKSIFYQAIGAERIETMLDTFMEELPSIIGEDFGREKVRLRPRFSPGFGDLPIDIQAEFLRIVEAKKRLGIALNDSMLMSPSKSVTAIVGIYE